MKILVVSAADATNLSIENVLIEFLRRGHQIEVFTQMSDNKTVQMFKKLNLPLHSINDLTKEKVAQFNIAFCGTDAIHRLIFEDIYVFSYNFIFNGWTSGGSDFMFTISEKRQVRYEEDCATMAIGVPKNDTPQIAKPKKQFLYIDAGHIPFGMKGKEEVARVILDICQKFPDYKLVIKPRWLLTDSNKTHPNGIHIYTLLRSLTNNELPDNLVLLNEHLDMQTLIDESISVITTSNSCWLDAALRGKGCIVIGNLDHEDKYDIRTNVSLKRELTLVDNAGCLVDYRQVINYLPYGIKCKDQFLNDFLPCQTGASSHIVDVVEYIYETFLQYGKFPKIQKYNYTNYRTEIIADNTIDMDYLKYKRMKNSVINISRVFDSIDADIDYGEYYELLEESYTTFPLNQKGYKALLQKMADKNNQIRIREREKLMTDSINQSFLFQSLYESKQYMDLLHMEKNDILCNEAYHYYLAMMYYDEKLYRKSLQSFYEYLQEASKKTYAKYKCEEAAGMRDCFVKIANMYDGTNLELEKFAIIYEILHERELENKIPYKEKKKLYQYAEIAIKQLYENENYKLAAQCAIHCMNQRNIFNEDKKRVGILKQEKEHILNCLSYRIGRLITFLPRKARHGIQWFKNTGLRQGITEKATSTIKIWNVFNQKVIKGYYLYVNFLKKYGSNAYLLLTGAGTGDAYIFGMMFQSYAQKKYQDKIAVLEIYGSTSEKIAKLFDIENTFPCTIEEVHMLFNLFMFLDNSLIHIDTMHYQITYRHTAILQYIEGLHNFNLFTESSAYLNIDSEKDFTIPKFNYDETSIKKIFEDIGCAPGKTVILAPYAKSVKRFSILFWQCLADKLLERGYCVCTNSIGDNEPAIFGTVPIFVPYDQSVPFIEKAGAVIALRSGFLDVVSTAQCLKISIVSQENWTRTPICHLSEVFNMVNMYHQPKQYDFVYTPENMDGLIQEIVDLVCAELKPNAVSMSFNSEG